MNILTKTILPAEWSQQDAILLSWPHQSMDWQAILEEVQPAFDEMAYYICLGQKLIIIAYDDEHKKTIAQRLNNKGVNLESVSWLIHANNDTWCRDFGPITVIKDGRTIALDFEFNGWGDKYAHDADNLTSSRLKANKLINCPLEPQTIILEGGSIDSDGEGTLLTTTTCLLSPQRNPSLNRQQIEDKLSELLGCEHLIWISHGYLEGDDTDSHIDNLARFCSADTIAYAACDDENDAHYQSLKKMEDELRQLKTKNGHAYQLIALNIPQAIYDEGRRVPASYVNFLITNDYVLMPGYNDEQDKISMDKLQRVFTDRKVICIDSSSVIKQSGSLHCLTMQLPQHTIA